MIRGRRALAIVFALMALNALVQVALVPMGRSDDPPVLVALQLLIGGTGSAASVGSWRGARWAPGASIAYGLSSAGMLLALPTILGLPSDARPGMWIGAGLALSFSLWSAWFLRRAANVASPGAP